MNFNGFKSSLAEKTPIAGTSALLTALWWDARGDWERAHSIAQSIDNIDGSLVHAYLHRKDGDVGNASYWYRRAGWEPFEGSLDKEWEELARRFCSR